MFQLNENRSKRESRQRSIEMLQKVQIPTPEKRVHEYPHQLSGGMWWMIVFPGAALISLVVGINLFADWLREELNPKIERQA